MFKKILTCYLYFKFRFVLIIEAIGKVSVLAFSYSDVYNVRTYTLFMLSKIVPIMKIGPVLCQSYFHSSCLVFPDLVLFFFSDAGLQCAISDVELVKQWVEF